MINATSSLTRCKLSRRIIFSASNATTIRQRLFSTSTTRLADPPITKKFRGNSSFDSSKNRKGSGNTKNFSKSVLTGNYKKKAGNGEIIESLPTLNNEKLKLNEIHKFNDEILQKLYIAGSFRPRQFNELFQQPVTLTRPNETQKIFEFYQSSLVSESKSNRLILTGESGVGKSSILTQFHFFALSQDSILLPFTNPMSLVDGSTDFKFNTETKLYDQQMSSKRFLKKFRNLNKEKLSELNLASDYKPIYDSRKLQESCSLTKSNSLLDLVNLALKNQINATHIFTTLITELQSQNKFPVYLTIDDFNAFIQKAKTSYRDTTNSFIYFGKFQIADTLLNIVNGTTSFNTGGVVISTTGQYKINETLSTLLNSKPENYYAKFKDWDQELSNRLLENGGLQHLKVERLSASEIQNYLRLLNSCNLIFNEFEKEKELQSLNGETDEWLKNLSNKKYFLSGNGNARSLIRSCVMDYA